MRKHTTKPVQSPRHHSVESSSRKPPIDLDALTPQQRTRLDKAVMMLVEYLVAASAQAG